MPRCSRCRGIAHIRIPRSVFVQLTWQATRLDYLCLDCFEQEPEELIARGAANAGPPV